MTNVLLVEDDMLLARHLERVLKKADFSVNTTPHALGAIAAVDEVRPAVIVLDMLLTGSTAMPLLHELTSHEDLASIPIIVVTSLNDETLAKALESYGVETVLDKATMKPDDIVVAVRRVLA